MRTCEECGSDDRVVYFKNKMLCQECEEQYKEQYKINIRPCREDKQRKFKEGRAR